MIAIMLSALIRLDICGRTSGRLAQCAQQSIHMFIQHITID
jgi:hypothetical protein